MASRWSCLRSVLGMYPAECGVELSLQRGVVGQRGEERLACRLVGGAVAEPLAGVGQRGDAGGGGQQERPEDVGRDLAFVVLELEMVLQVFGGETMDVLAVEDTMGWAHGSLRDRLRYPKPYSKRTLRPSISISCSIEGFGNY